MILWGRASSVNVQKVLWALHEYNLEYDHRIVGGRYGGLDDPAFTRLTPNRKVPVLEDGPHVIWESHAILRYLGRRDPSHPLSGRLDRADPWMEFGTASLQPPFIGLFWQVVRMKPKERSATAIETQCAALSDALDVLEAGIGEGGPWLAGEGMSLADIALGTIFYRLSDIAPDLLRDRPQITAWVERLASRPGWQAHVATNYDELRPG